MTPDKSDYRTCPFLVLHLSGLRVNLVANSLCARQEKRVRCESQAAKSEIPSEMLFMHA
jgi:hypothetical protein